MGRVRGKKWMQEHVADVYVKKARAEGARSRAAYKLEQLAERDRLLAPGMTVVDLGAAPGGWSQVAAGAVGPRGRVFALDMLDMASLPGVTFIRGDFHDEAVAAQLEMALGARRADLVLSDLAPNVSGIASADQARMEALAGLALDFALKHLKPKGNLVVKLFHGAAFQPFLQQMRSHFASVAVRKPDASRDRSSEIYLVGKGLRG
jgi:23S rRNA (uridine2552-2'-O)-methyltransferase